MPLAAQDGVTTKNPGPHPIEQAVSLYEMLQQSLQAFRESRALDLVVRCESLPLVKADARQCQHLLSLILEIVVGQTTSVRRQYLSIVCAEEDRQQRSGATKPEWNYYTIQFHTNGRSESKWMEKHGSLIRECETILSAMNGSCQVSAGATAGCVVSITLPGKQSK